MVTVLFSPHEQDLVERVRQALSARPAFETRLEGRARYMGTDARFVLQFKADGSFVQRVIGPVVAVSGFDGKAYWGGSNSGAVRELALGSADVDAAPVFFWTGRWLDDPNVERAVSTADADNVLLRFKGSGLRERIFVDVESALPKRAVFDSVAGSIEVLASDWREVDGRKVPFHFEVKQGAVTNVFTVDKVGKPEGRYSMPTWQPHDTVFDGQKTANVESKRAPTGHVLVHPRVNGQDVGWFILDTGAEVMVIDPAVAKGLGLQKVGALTLTGIGGNVESSFRKAGTFELGPAKVKGLFFSELDLSAIGRIFGVPIAGVIGNDFFDRAVVLVTLSASRVQVYDPSKYKLPKAARWQGIKFAGGNPAVEASLEGGRRAWFRFDTGSDGSVAFHSPYVVQEKLLEGRQTQGALHGGAGGFVKARAGKVEWFELGGHRFEKPDVTFSLAEKGALADPSTAGNIGQAFMTPFTVVVDFGRSRLAFLPASP